MISRPRLIYWDSSVFLSYINGVPDRFETIKACMLTIKDKDNLKIVTSLVSKVEVANAMSETETATFDPAIEATIDAMWADRSVVRMAEFHNYTAIAARTLIRAAKSEGHSLRPMDAIHLATAQQVGASEIHTYDQYWAKLSNLVGIRICEPYIEQPRLPNV